MWLVGWTGAGSLGTGPLFLGVFSAAVPFPVILKKQIHHVKSALPVQCPYNTVIYSRSTLKLSMKGTRPLIKEGTPPLRGVPYPTF
jgi:hypothetical protein